MSDALKILTYPQDAAILRQKSAPVAIPDMKSAYELAKEMLKLLDGKTQLGLSAVQVGKALRIFVIKIDKFEKIFINPKIELRTRDRTTVIESCLSFNTSVDFYRITRAQGLKISHRTLNGNIELEQFFDLPALVIQHEMDHLEGRLMHDTGEKVDVKAEQVVDLSALKA